MKSILTAITLAMTVTAAPCVFAQQEQQAQSPRRDAQTTPSKPAPDAKTLTMRGEIESVDRETRTITLKGKDGRISMLRAGPDFANFDQLEKGEKVTVRYAEAMLLSIGKLGGAAQAQTDTGAGKQPDNDRVPLHGAKPTQAMGTITEIDGSNNAIRLSAQNGEELRLSVRDKSALSGLQKGDEVSVSYVEPFALSVKEDDGSTAEAGTGDEGHDAAPRRRR